MRLQEIKLVNFRKHSDLIFAPTDGINVLYGPNGSGKTNILEAIHYCALAKGLNKSLDRECLRFTADYFLLHGRFIDERDIEIAVKVSYAKASDKKIFLNSEELKKYSGLVGRIPCITFSPMELTVVNGSPQERRRFIDNALSQTDKRYLDDLLQYRRVLQQRNTLLSVMGESTINSDNLDVWTERLSLLAGSIISARLDFIERLLIYCRSVYEQLGLGEVPGLSYRSSVSRQIADMKEKEIVEAMMLRFKEITSQELHRKQTLLGPHRDDIVFRLDGIEVKKYASQGQLRTFLIAIKLALQRFIHEVTGESPLFLLDDLFSELDRKRVEKVLLLLKGSGQSIITATDKQEFDGIHCISIRKIAGEIEAQDP
ncbi:DNA replication/repair protein RecF [Prosthecochloris sp.]|uniref:DNA replication/repair protein RecF n=1 Tax=Prosthecochloris sp. TaxID=290513 RepID=UPI0025F4B238|nr:DNA replication/repair protein RecF [Prosthecochloris sp.]